MKIFLDSSWSRTPGVHKVSWLWKFSWRPDVSKIISWTRFGHSRILYMSSLDAFCYFLVWSILDPPNWFWILDLLQRSRPTSQSPSKGNLLGPYRAWSATYRVPKGLKWDDLEVNRKVWGICVEGVFWSKRGRSRWVHRWSSWKKVIWDKGDFFL